VSTAADNTQAGAELNELLPQPVPSKPQRKIIWKILGIVLVLLIIISLLGQFAVAILSTKVPGRLLLSIAFWLGVLAALAAKRYGRSVFLWFALGFVGLGGFSAFLTGFIRSALER